MSRRHIRREVFFTAEDADAFGQALLQHFPRVVCLSLARNIDAPVRFLASLGACACGDWWIGFPDPEWNPELMPTQIGHGIDLVSYPVPGFSYQASHKVYKREGEDGAGGSWQVRTGGLISMSRRADDERHAAFVRQILKILNRTSTSRLAPFDRASGQSSTSGKTNPGVRAGYHAVRWTLESERRYLEPVYARGLLRPRPATETMPSAGERPHHRVALTARRCDEIGKRSGAKRRTRDEPDFQVPEYGLKTQAVFFTREDSHEFGRRLKSCFPFVAFCSHSRLEDRRTRFHNTLGEIWDGGYVIHVSDDNGARTLDVANWPSRVWTSNPPRWRFYYVARHGARASPLSSTKGAFGLAAGHVGVQYRTGDSEGLRFAERIMTILEQVSTTRLARFDRQRGRFVDAPEAAIRVRAGYHAVVWCLKDDRRVLGDTLSFDPELGRPAYRPTG